MTACVAVLAAGFLVAAEAAAQTQGAFDRTLNVSGTAAVNVRSGAGEIRVRSGASASVRVVGRIEANHSWLSGSDAGRRIKAIEANPPIEQQGNTITIGRFADEDLQRDLSISYDVTVPVQTALTAKTGSGSIDIGDLQGAVDASSGSGSITIGRVGGPVTASAGSGGIEVAGAGGLKAHTGSGSIVATGVAGTVSAKSGSGSVRVSMAGKGDVEASAASGAVTVAGVDGAARVSSASGSVSVTGRPAGAWSIHSASGSVRLSLPADAAFDLDARSNSGGVDTSHPVTMTGSIEKHTVRGKVRGGGPLVEVTSASGGITIR
jgi:DUF4097 and DUF4098 domain-containing protein YvlB